MKVFRIVGLLGILAAVCSGMTGTARAGVVHCSFQCSNTGYTGTCYLSLQSCCDALPSLCPDGTEYRGGGCSDGQSYC
ncbi:MAG: hypothetical protein JF614_11240 [Acidobacteria bacterium]|nr:hypothetical protein [Acidobacteriota bacterium]